MKQVRRIQDIRSIQDALEISGVPKPKEATHNGIQVYHLTDLGNARRLVDRHGHDLKYVAHSGWYQWTGKRWARVFFRMPASNTP